MITNDDLLTLLPGRKVVITHCEAREHGNNSGCVCSLKGSIQTLDRLYKSFFTGTPSWHLRASNKTVRLSEVTLIADPATTADSD